MHSASSDDLTDRQMWLAERRDAALAAFARRVPPLYQTSIQTDPRVDAWAAAGLHQTASLFLAGPIGVGKTHSAWTASAAYLAGCFDADYQRNPTIETWRSTALLDALRKTYDDGQNRDLVPRLQSVDLLYIDDLAAARPNAWTQERLFELLDERYIQRRPVLITCDVLPNALGDIVGPRVASRLAEMCRSHVVYLDGTDRRGGAR